MDQREPIVVFAYNFPHRKTQDFLFRLQVEGFRVSHVLAADPVKLNIPPSEVRTKLRHCGLVHPREVAGAVGAEYVVVPHAGEEIAEILDGIGPGLGVIAGARILKRPVIDRFSIGIINFHPGLIPEARGLDALLWSIRGDLPLGVTSHLIDERVDAGRILERREIPLHADDTIFDLSERLYEVQIEMLRSSVAAAREGRWEDLDYGGTAYNRKMSGDDERATLDELPAYLQRHSGGS